MKKLFCILAFTVSQLAFGQQNIIDSLRNIIKKDKLDTNKVIHLNTLSKKYILISSLDTSLYYSNCALELGLALSKVAQEPTNKKVLLREQADSYSNIGITYANKGNYPEALKNFLLSLKISEEIGDKKGSSKSYNGIGNIKKFQGNYPEALKNYFSSLKLKEEINDKRGIANSYGMIGVIYFDQHNYTEAQKNYSLSLKIREEIGDKQGLAISYGYIANVYLAQGNFREGLKSHQISLKLSEEVGNMQSVSNAYGGIGEAYRALEDNSKAIENFLLSLKISEEIGDKRTIAKNYCNIGAIYSEQGKFKEAEEYFNKAIDLLKETNTKELMPIPYKGLADIDSTRGNFKGVYENYKLYILYRDSLDNEETRKKTIQSQMTYDFDKKEAVAEAEHKSELKQQAIIAEERNRKQKLVTAFVIGGLFLVLVFAGFVFRSLRITRKQKALIEKQKIVVEQHQKDIVDSIHYARRIQTALLPTEKYIEKNINRLRKI